MTAYETGYSAFLKGIDAKDNPFDAELAPFSRKRWDEGWTAARKRKADKSR
jgi:hypothetical protein